MTVTIVEITGRSTQGRTEPFICRGDDDRFYYVKGHSAGRESQIKEIICGHLALALGLPVAPFEIVEVPAALINSGVRPDLISLGAGPAFGSCQRASVTEITYAQLKKVPQRTGQDVVMFDWWIQNADRSLTEHGGNPNLLWDQAADKLMMIDHNLAFDRAFNRLDFAGSHVFHGLIASVFEDLDLRLKYASRLKIALTNFQAICDNLPETWIEEAPHWFDLASVEQTLRRYDENSFWAIE